MPQEHYADRLRQIESEASIAQARADQMMQLLIALGVAAALSAWWLAEHKLQLWYVALAIPAAIVLNELRRKATQRSAALDRLKTFCEAGVARLRADWDSAGDDGSAYLEDDHLYAADLDLFGRGSLFQLMNTARTSVGKETLASWMNSAAPLDQISARHAAIEELRRRSDLREALALAGRSGFNDVRAQTFAEWLDAPTRNFPGFVPAMGILFAAGTLLIPVLGVFHWIASDSVLNIWAMWVGAQCVFASTFRQRVRSIVEDSRLPSFELPVLIELAKILAKEKFESPFLRDLQHATEPALGQLPRLKRLFWLLEARNFELIMLPCYAVLWGTQLAIAVERWRARHREEFRDWLAALASFEAINAVACYAFEHPHDTFPELTREAPLFEAEGLGHPLIPDEQCVRNDVTLDGRTRFFLVSGSNMSGKSTFLRAIGLNAVLAGMGAPVRALRLRVSPLSAGTSMRLQDSLESGRSHFMAEVARLRRLMDVAQETPPLLFLIDEVMSGTNSHDRRIASEVLVRRLLDSGAIGLITTHDLSLTEIASVLSPAADNVHFTDATDTGGLDFDYKLKPGIARSSNGLAILGMLGLIPDAVPSDAVSK